jgi:hypothetical protein
MAATAAAPVLGVELHKAVEIKQKQTKGLVALLGGGQELVAQEVAKVVSGEQAGQLVGGGELKRCWAGHRVLL